MVDPLRSKLSRLPAGRDQTGSRFPARGIAEASCCLEFQRPHEVWLICVQDSLRIMDPNKRCRVSPRAGLMRSPLCGDRCQYHQCVDEDNFTDSCCCTRILPVVDGRDLAIVSGEDEQCLIPVDEPDASVARLVAAGRTYLPDSP